MCLIDVPLAVSVVLTSKMEEPHCGVFTNTYIHTKPLVMLSMPIAHDIDVPEMLDHAYTCDYRR